MLLDGWRRKAAQRKAALEELNNAHQELVELLRNLQKKEVPSDDLPSDQLGT